MTRGEALALAQQSCATCLGLGVRPTRGGKSTTCNCVFRAIFRACYARFRHCISSEGYLARVNQESAYNGPRGPRYTRFQTFGMRKQEYAADFVLIARRLLAENSIASKVFRFHFLLGADWKLCTHRIGINRGQFFHEVYRIQQQLGRAFAELEPYGLWPLDEYFGSIATNTRSTPVAESLSTSPLSVVAEAEGPTMRPLRFPLKANAA